MGKPPSLVLLFVNTVAYLSNLLFTAEAQRAQRVFIFYLPLILQTERRTGRPANKKTQALRAKSKAELRIVQFHICINCESILKLLIA
jgi:hypothetical protein